MWNVPRQVLVIVSCRTDDLQSPSVPRSSVLYCSRHSMPLSSKAVGTCVRIGGTVQNCSDRYWSSGWASCVVGSRMGKSKGSLAPLNMSPSRSGVRTVRLVNGAGWGRFREVRTVLRPRANVLAGLRRRPVVRTNCEPLWLRVAAWAIRTPLMR